LRVWFKFSGFALIHTVGTRPARYAWDRDLDPRQHLHDVPKTSMTCIAGVQRSGCIRWHAIGDTAKRNAPPQPAPSVQYGCHRYHTRGPLTTGRFVGCQGAPLWPVPHVVTFLQMARGAPSYHQLLLSIWPEQHLISSCGCGSLFKCIGCTDLGPNKRRTSGQEGHCSLLPECIMLYGQQSVPALGIHSRRRCRACSRRCWLRLHNVV
jgi:hypothetical protein